MATMEEIYMELADQEEAKLVAKNKEQVPAMATDQEFDSAIKTLLYYQHRIDDIASVATRFIADARNKYNYFLQQCEPFLRHYAIAHLKRDKDGNVKSKNYKSLAAGGGVFFRQKAQKITFNNEQLPKIKEFIERYLPDKAEVITEKTVYEVTNKQELVDVLQQIADAKARELFANPEEITVGTVKAIDEIYSEMDIQIEEADPYYYMHIGTNKANTFRHLKANLTQAIDGSFRADQEEDIDVLIEDLEDEQLP